ncbi:MAG: CHAT domain-containing protein, partial [Chloroflexi bacterium]|nr:CHAT domain-containing protein [Chloroflexota bacterium]
MQARGLVVLERLDAATYSALQRKLRQNVYHVFHFIGHGGLSERTNEGVLVFTNEFGGGQEVGSLKLAHLFGDHDSLRLVILNACEGARSTRQDPFASVAASLVQREIPAVVAMQFEISDEAALQFSSEFYSVLAEGSAVDTAMSEARKAIWGSVSDLEWGTPVLYMRAPDGVIFDLKNASPIQVPPAVEPPPPIRIEPKQEPSPAQVIRPAPPAAEGAPQAETDIEEQKRRLQEAIDAGKEAARQRKEELMKRFEADKAPSLSVQTTLPAPKIELPARKTNKAGQEMILIPAGEFLMGTTDAEAQRVIREYGKDYEQYVRWEQPQHTVSLDAFYISRYLVTNAEYKKFVDATNYKTPQHWQNGKIP